MKLPKHYTVKQCLDALDGLIVKYDSVPWTDLSDGYLIRSTPHDTIGIHSMRTALSKYPLDALVQLTVEETNELFGGE